MTVEQEVLETSRRPKRRALTAFLLGGVPLVIAGVAGAAASAFAPVPDETPVALPVEAPAGVSAVIEAQGDVSPGVVAPTVKEKADVPQVSVSFEPEPEPEPAPVAVSQTSQLTTSQKSTSSGSSSSSSSKSTSSSKPAPSKSHTSYCGSPSSPYSAGGSVKGLLTAANKERARLGIGPMSWSSSLASAATSWSSSMAKRDEAGNGSALAHNPNRPGGENVAVSGSSAGMSVGTAVNKAHIGWMYSYGHCVNVMNPGYSSMGAGSASTANGKAVYTTANYR